MNIKIDNQIKVEYLKLEKNKRNLTEIPISILWEHSEHVFPKEDNIPPKEWDYQIHKVKL